MPVAESNDDESASTVALRGVERTNPKPCCLGPHSTSSSCSVVPVGTERSGVGGAAVPLASSASLRRSEKAKTRSEALDLVTKGLLTFESMQHVFVIHKNVP